LEQFLRSPAPYNREYVVLNVATQESWKNDKGDYETRTEWHRVYACLAAESLWLARRFRGESKTLQTAAVNSRHRPTAMDDRARWGRFRASAHERNAPEERLSRIPVTHYSASQPFTLMAHDHGQTGSDPVVPLKSFRALRFIPRSRI